MELTTVQQCPLVLMNKYKGAMVVNEFHLFELQYNDAHRF